MFTLGRKKAKIRGEDSGLALAGREFSGHVFRCDEDV